MSVARIMITNCENDKKRRKKHEYDTLKDNLKTRLLFAQCRIYS